MADPVNEHASELKQLCLSFHVKTLELFGSASAGDFDPERSDLDFLVDFLPLEPGTHAKAYFGLWFGLQDLFGRDIDLVETPAINNRFFLHAVNRQRKVVYAA